MTNLDLLGLDAPHVWDTGRAFRHLQQIAQADTKRTAERRLHEIGLLPPELKPDLLEDSLGRRPTPQVLNWAIERARSKRNLVLFAQLYPLPEGRTCLHANDARGGRYWVPMEQTPVDPARVGDALRRLQGHIGKEIAVFPHGDLVDCLRRIPAIPRVLINLLGYPPVLDLHLQQAPTVMRSQHLKQLEAESIHIIREAIAEASNPVMLYSLGKDSSVMLHLARKAFFPATPPFPLLHVDTRWKFQEMYLFRDHMAQSSGMELLVHVNPEAIAKDINPFDHGSALHTHITKTEGLKQALDQHGFDVVFGGARRDEEKSRAKERIFSFRTQTHHWDPKQQRPELWNLYNTRKNPKESIRVFPLSNWTELDIWQYIYQEQIAIVPLYFAQERPVVIRNNMILMVDDHRFRLLPGEEIEAKHIRFRTLGCYPLTGAVESLATTVADIILELAHTRYSERQGRAIDADSGASMERKKQEGYF
jgi:sulfate adenylyltransferase subunit 2